MSDWKWTESRVIDVACIYFGGNARTWKFNPCLYTGAMCCYAKEKVS